MKNRKKCAEEKAPRYNGKKKKRVNPIVPMAAPFAPQGAANAEKKKTCADGPLSPFFRHQAHNKRRPKS